MTIVCARLRRVDKSERIPMFRRLFASASALVVSTGTVFAAPVGALARAQDAAANGFANDAAAGPSGSNAERDHSDDEGGEGPLDRAARALVRERQNLSARDRSGMLGGGNVSQHGAGSVWSSIVQSDQQQFADVSQHAAPVGPQVWSSIVQGGGEDNVAIVRQIAALPSADLAQVADSDSATIRKFGWNLRSDITQFGSSNTAFILQADAAKTSRIFQNGDGNFAEASQLGAGALESMIDQSSDDNFAKIAQLGLDLKSDVAQLGSGNIAIVVQYGQAKTSSIVQTGENLAASVMQTATPAAVSRIVQSGALHVAIVRQ
jgi:hypothetical protein